MPGAPETIQGDERRPTASCAVVGARPVGIRRAEPTGDPAPIPRPDPDQPQRVSADKTWGTVQPIQLADDVHTVGEARVGEPDPVTPTVLSCNIPQCGK